MLPNYLIGGKLMKKVLLVYLCFILVMCLSGCGNEYQDRIYIIDQETNVINPNEGKLKFCSSLNVFLHGRLPSFQVFSFDCYQDKFIEENGFKSSIDEDEIYWFKKKIEQCKKNIEIPDDYVPNFDDDLLFLYINDVYFIYEKDINELVVFINSR